MRSRILLILLTTITAVAGLSVGTAGAAHAAPRCPDVQLVLARGTAEAAPPVGVTGLSFGNALTGRLPGKSVRVSAVDYPAGSNFNDRGAFARSVIRGINNAQRQIRAIAARCPRTDIVVGGYSQGGVVAGYAVADRIDIPAKYARYRSEIPTPLPAAVARHVSAVVLFAPPSARWIRQVGAPPMNVGAAYRGKTTRYCIPGDNVCDGAPVGQPSALHVLYSVNGMTNSAANFVARRIG